VTLAEYADRYGKSLRTVKRWRAIGEEAGDRCPLESPEKMMAWWQRHMRQKPPDGLLKQLGGPIAVPESKPEVPSEPAGDEQPGMEAALKRLEDTEVLLHGQATQPGGTKPWLDTLARMTTLRGKLREELEKEGRLLPKDMVERTIHELHGPIALGVRGMYRTMCELLPAVPDPVKEAEWGKACDQLFERLGKEVLSEV
jgi:hypothetical protein